jgi:hypothetical protein
MNGKTSGLIALGALFALGVAGLNAQEPVQERQRAGLRRGPSTEALLSSREELGLTEDQVAALEALRAEGVQRRTDEAAELAELRSRLAAGQIGRSELMAFREERAGSREALQAQHRERVEAVLNQEQLAQVEQFRAQADAFRRGRASARGERGVRSGRGERSARQGAPGRGFGAERGWDRQGRSQFRDFEQQRFRRPRPGGPGGQAAPGGSDR